MRYYIKCKICNKSTNQYYEWICLDCIQSKGDIELLGLINWAKELIPIINNMKDCEERKILVRKALRLNYLYWKYLKLYYNRLGGFE